MSFPIKGALPRMSSTGERYKSNVKRGMKIIFDNGEITDTKLKLKNISNQFMI